MKLFLLLLHNDNVGAVMNHNINISVSPEGRYSQLEKTLKGTAEKRCDIST